MSERATQLAEQFEATCNEVLSFAESCDDEQCGAICPAEGWANGTVVRHIAGGMLFEIDVIARIAGGRDARTLTMDEIHAHNADNVGIVPNRAETIAALRKNTERVTGMVRKLSDEQLQRSAAVEFMGNQEKTVDWLVEHLLIGHVAGHFESLCSATGSQAAQPAG